MTNNSLRDSLLHLQTVSALSGWKSPLAWEVRVLGQCWVSSQNTLRKLNNRVQKRNSVNESQLSPLLHLEFQNLHFMSQSFRLQPPNHQTLASDTTCLLGMFFRLHKLTRKMKNNLFKYPHYSFDAGIMKISISQQRKLRNGKNTTYLR